MATLFVATGGSNTSPYETWAKAATTLQTALSAVASGGGDIVVVKYDDAHNVAADTTFTTAGSCTILSASNDGGSSFTPTAMAETGWIGHGTTSYSITLDGGNDDKLFLWGLTFRVAGSTLKVIRLNNSLAGCDIIAENCKLWQSGTGTGNAFVLNGSLACSVALKNCELKFGAAGQSVALTGTGAEIIDSVLTGTAPTTLIASAQGHSVWRGCDLSLVNGTLVGSISSFAHVTFERCKMYSTFPTAPTVLAAQTGNPNNSSAKALLLDCHGGNTHGFFAYYDAMGSVVTDTTVKVTSGAAGQSWKITTTANCSFTHPFMTPWIDLHNTGTSAITPKLEIVRTGSATAYKDNEVWSEWLVKTESGFTQAKDSDDRQTFANWIAGTAGVDQTTGDLGASDWEEEGATVWFGKLSPGSLTPDEVGSLSARVCVGLASISGTLYVDPQIRT